MIELTVQPETLLLELSLVHRDELRRLAPLLRSLLQGVEAAGGQVPSSLYRLYFFALPRTFSTG